MTVVGMVLVIQNQVNALVLIIGKILSIVLLNNVKMIVHYMENVLKVDVIAMTDIMDLIALKKVAKITVMKKEVVLMVFVNVTVSILEKHVRNVLA
jgi:hypothetical protein